MRRPSIPHRLRHAIADQSGASPVEFVLVGLLLTVLTLGVIQFGVAVYARNVAHDAAVDGAFHAALADTTAAEGAERTREVLRRALGADYAADVTADERMLAGAPTVRVVVRAPLPVLGLFGVPAMLEVIADAPRESLG